MTEINNDKGQINEVSNKQERITPVKSNIEGRDLEKRLLIKGENPKEYRKMKAKLLQEMLIEPEMEINFLVEKIFSTQWKLHRAMKIERNMLNEQNEINEHERHGSSYGPKPRERIRNIKKVRLNSPEIQYIQQYQLELEKVFQKTLERLREEQSLHTQKSGKNE